MTDRRLAIIIVALTEWLRQNDGAPPESVSDARNALAWALRMTHKHGSVAQQN